MALLDETARRRIEAAIGELEKRTAAEVVVAVVRRSTNTWAERALVSFAAALGAGFGFFELWPSVDPRFGLFVQLVVGFGVAALFGVPVLGRLLVTRAAARAEVEAEAFALFARRGLYRTRSHTGVLLLVSELERHVVILGDLAIHERLGPTGWQAHIDRIVESIHRGRAAQGIVEVLGELGTVLAELAPPEQKNEDELPNAVLEDQ